MPTLDLTVMLERLRRALTRHSRGNHSIFTDIYINKGWQGSESASGTGSDLTQTYQLRKQLERLFAEYDIRNLLDLPCGDFHWMETVNLGGVNYVGADIVVPLIEANRKRYPAGPSFIVIDLVHDPLPQVDMILCRDCLVHLSIADCQRAFANIIASESHWLLTTTFPAWEANHDTKEGKWRPLNLALAPFGLPDPLEILNEGCTENDGLYGDKSLALYRVEDLARCLA